MSPYYASLSKFGGVQIGAITYSFNRIACPDPEAIIKAYVEIGLGEAELMSNHCEALAGAPPLPMFGRVGGAARPPAGGSPSGGSRAGAAGGAPKAPGAGRPPLTPEQLAERKAAQEKLSQWRNSVTGNTWKTVARKFQAAGIGLALLCYNMRDSMTDEDVEYGFRMAQGLGVKGIKHHKKIANLHI